MVMQDREIKDLEQTLEQIWEVARRFGLDPFPTRFEIVPATVMYEIGSYALPGRYSHWTFGKAYHRMKTMYDFGLSKIYEVVINTNRRMVETVSAHAGRMSGYEFRYGRKAVERLLDAVLSIEEHIDPNFFIRREPDAPAGEAKKKKPEPKPGRY